MIQVLTKAQIQQAEREADQAGHSYEQMMAFAGRSVASRAIELVQGRAQPKFTILVGSGNNGGDGLVAGRVIAETIADAQVRFYLLTRRDDPNFEAIQALGLFIAYAEDDDGRVIRHMVASADLVIDALYGIGVRLPISGDAQKILRQTRQALNENLKLQRDRVLIDPLLPHQVERPPKQYVLAVDCPSGLDCDTGEIDPNALHADETITFIAAKPGLLTFPGAAAVGQLWVSKLQLPDDLPTLGQATPILLDQDTARNLLPPRPVDGHKGTFGKLLIVAGSINYTGAVALCARSAYRSGVGVVSVGAPSSVITALATGLIEATWIPLPDDHGVIAENATQMIQTHVITSEALLIGPGLGREQTTRAMLKALLTTAHDTAWVIDADGLNLLSEIPDWWTLLPSDAILTPHPGEMARLCGLTIAEVQANRIGLAVEKARAWGAVIVLKGAHTVIVTPSGEIAYGPFKTDALATAGTGDILAGLIAGFRTQGVSAFAAAQLGVYLQGYAGLITAEQFGTGRAVIASDIIERLPVALSAIAVG
ncbi:MAG: NAD(P)H-hydrate dehydratase [Anaerolineae bacterium]|nr:NAD(P)H-hydrate dehydratase [Anaerolineae bacterium]